MSDGRITGSRLQEIRRRFRQDEPLCAVCKAKGKVVAWAELDHIIPLFKGGVDSTDPFENRQGLCKPCHAEKTRVDLNYKEIGADAEGWPIDPRHPWNQKKA